MDSVKNLLDSVKKFMIGEMTMKSRIKIKYDDSNSPKTVAWMESVFDKSYLFEDIDVYHRIFTFTDGVYSIFEESADGAGDIWLNLIIGPEKAMLIDTGFGIGDLKAVVDRLTGGKELIVANTHEHLDHVMGNYQFGRVYCHMYGVSSITGRFMSPNIWDRLYDETGKGIWLDFDKKDIIEYKPYELVPCLEGRTFDLGGGHIIEMVHTPGHAAGGASYIDRKNRILFSGGLHTNYIGIGGKPGIYTGFHTIDAFRDSLIRLKDKHFDEFDRIFPAHEIVDLDKSFILDQITVCNDVIENNDNYEFTAPTPRGAVLKYHGCGLAGVRFTERSFKKL